MGSSPVNVLFFFRVLSLDLYVYFILFSILAERSLSGFTFGHPAYLSSPSIKLSLWVAIAHLLSLTMMFSSLKMTGLIKGENIYSFICPTGKKKKKTAAFKLSKKRGGNLDDDGEDLRATREFTLNPSVN